MTEGDRTAPPLSAGPSPADPPGTGTGTGTAGGPDRLDSLDPHAVTLWRLGYFFRGAVFVAVALLSEMVLDLPIPGGLLAFVLAMITLLVAVLLPPARYRAWGYRLGESDLYLRHGVFIRTTSIVPHARIQHVDTSHGPVDRYFGLADVVVFTAGTRGAILTIPALDAERAEALRDRLVALSGAGDAV